MSFDDLWDKYGKKTAPQQEDSTIEKKHYEKPATRVQNDYKKEQTILNKERNVVTEKKTSDTQEGITGVFGGGTPPEIETHDPKTKWDWDLQEIRNWPWVDIICITITVVMIIGVIVNFEEVTTAIFNILLPLFYNIFVLLLIAGGVILLTRWLVVRRGHRRW